MDEEVDGEVDRRRGGWEKWMDGEVDREMDGWKVDRWKGGWERRMDEYGNHDEEEVAVVVVTD